VPLCQWGSHVWRREVIVFVVVEVSAETLHLGLVVSVQFDVDQRALVPQQADAQGAGVDVHEETHFANLDVFGGRRHD